jgi:ATP-dependent phosphoenolpyruvate carboxykinase
MFEQANDRDANVLAYLGVSRTGPLNHNWNEAALYQEAVQRGEGEVAKGGALVVKTGQHTGRSAKDKFTVRDEGHRKTRSGGITTPP